MAVSHHLSAFAAKGDQLRAGNAQIILGVQDNGFIQLAGVKGNLRVAIEQQRIGNQPQIRVKAERWDGAKNAGGERIDFRRTGQRCLAAADMLRQA